MRLISLSFLLLLVPLLTSCAKQKQVYIVYFGEHKGHKALHEIKDHHHSYLQSVKESKEDANSSLLYSYKHSINGFAAELTPDEASKLEKLKGVVSVFKSDPNKYRTHTTISWEFVGLEGGNGDDTYQNYDVNNRFRVGRKFLKEAKHGEGVIVGVIDSGVWPESRSFSDKGMGPIPESWNGICQTGVAFNSSHCNRKIIGARYYARGYERYYGPFNAAANKDFLSPRDADGHGSHTSSTAVGRQVNGVSAIGGIAMGRASGGASLARLAVYKACWAFPNAEKINGNTCFEEDLLAAFDDAIADGVHVISISIGSVVPTPYLKDGIAIGALHAAKRDIVVAASAGNEGPGSETLSNPAPWIITVGASTLDRFFVGGLELGNGHKYESDSVTTLKMETFAPLVYAADVVVPGVSMNVASLCLQNSLSPELVKGKVVLCLRGYGSRVGKSLEVKRAGGVGMILGNSPVHDGLRVEPHFVPTALVFSSEVNRILDYIYNDYEPIAIIKPAKTVLYPYHSENSFYPYKPAPFMTSFSSRGPNWVDPNILKPDIIAPGMNILAAWSRADSASKVLIDRRVTDYNIDSGTSMSCPHVAGAIALLKSLHPTWTSAAIRSALMTTASMTNEDNEPIKDYDGYPADPFALGSGHFRPTKAAYPGLVYDASYRSYLLYCCSLGLTEIDPTFQCPSTVPPAYNLNYPSISIPYLMGTVTVTRSVTCVGLTGNYTLSTYYFNVQPPFGVSVRAEPDVLVFDRFGQTKQFDIIVTPERYEYTGEARRDRYRFGWFSWTDEHHVVRSPIAVSLV